MANYTLYENTQSNVRGPGPVAKFTSEVIDIGAVGAVLDTFELFTVPKGCTPIAAYVEIVESAGEAATLDIGVTGGDTDGILDGVDINNDAGTVIQTAVGDDITGSTIFTAATTISALIATGFAAATAGKFRLHLVVAY